MVHRLNTNKQFMIGNGILAFSVIAIVIIFGYIGFRQSSQQDDYNEVYTISLTRGFVGDSLSIYVNDSLIINKRITEEPFAVSVSRFEEQSALMIIDQATDKLSTFDLSNKGGTVSLVKEENGIMQLAQ